MEHTSTNPDYFLNTREAAALLGLQPGTLRKMRWQGGGPRYIRLGQSRRARVLYRSSDIDEWLKAREFTSTAAEAAAEAER